MRKKHVHAPNSTRNQNGCHQQQTGQQQQQRQQSTFQKTVSTILKDFFENVLRYSFLRHHHIIIISSSHHRIISSSHHLIIIIIIIIIISFMIFSLYLSLLSFSLLTLLSCFERNAAAAKNRASWEHLSLEGLQSSLKNLRSGDLENSFFFLDVPLTFLEVFETSKNRYTRVSNIF